MKVGKKIKKLGKKIDQIGKLEKEIENSIPWDVWTTFGKAHVSGSVICFGEDNDYKTKEEVIVAAKWLIKNLK